MQTSWNILRVLGLLLLLGGLFAFSNHRNALRPTAKTIIEFKGSDNLYITEDAVNKMLIQTFGEPKNNPKENLDLNAMEKVLEANEMVKDAEVFLTLEGLLVAQIEQRTPLGRVAGETNFYLDEEGKRMPLSKSHSARVPIITGKITGKALEDVYTIIELVNTDEFYRKNVIGIHIVEENDYQLKFRLNDFVVHLGDVGNLEQKFSNFKAFYAKAGRDNTLDQFASVSLEFNNQVVCTKI
ncbi:cell division protein FtsQ/DivIB [Maribacter sp. 2307ULW6-5]|uniref:cell division protein FtsQ/DivIB n=1 Tax=Maribacter sp. 2307ULW6-5 TaxID=3386275 RepID=UPI0039BC82B7